MPKQTRIWLSVFLLLCGIALVRAQTPDSLPDPVIRLDSTLAVDTIESQKPQKKKGFLKGFFSREDYPNPGKAAVMSLVIPGAGQVYNKKYWKLPLIYGAMGALVYGIHWNNQEYKRFDEAFQLKKGGLDHEFAGTSIDSEQSLLNIRNGYRKDRELLSILLGLAYVLNGMDAYVDAHLLEFDVSEDLSLEVRPALPPYGNTAPRYAGLGVFLVLK